VLSQKLHEIIEISNNTLRLKGARRAGPTSSVATGSGCVFSHGARAVTVGSSPTFRHHAASSPK
jgi:cytochrome c551/c552